MLKNIIEALIFAAADGITYKTIKENLGSDYTEKELKTAIAEIKEEYSGEKGIIFIEYNSTYQFQSNPQYSELLADVLRTVKERQLSKTVLQTLSIIAYRQPITRAEIEELRGGISSDYAISVLIKAELIKPIGRKETIGRPVLYATTDNFLKRFQLSSLESLPDYNDILDSIRHSDKYNRSSENIYEIRNENLYSTDDVAYFDEVEDDKPDFLKGEDIVEIDSES
ncbi:MAG: SMC-Scp complex subunit ScpB [Clostridia bacterium]|nr:SMC-Scp complex subunit ScpB [Clostridia bacterium]